MMHAVRVKIAAALLLAIGLLATGTTVGLLHAADNSLALPPAKNGPTLQTAITGHRHLVFTQRSPLSDPKEFYRRPAYRALAVTLKENDYDLAAESFEAIIPPTYKPDAPHGLFVWLSPAGAQIPPEWVDVLARHKLIFISPNNFFPKNQMPHLRQALTLDAVHNMQQLYHIDENRIYISGFSGGGLASSQLLHGFPDIFRGAFFINGEDFYNSYKDTNGQLIPTTWSMYEWSLPIDELKKSLRLAILTGGRDNIFEPEISRGNYQGLLLDHFAHVSFFEIPDGGHAYPSALWFEKGLTTLDSPPPQTLPTTRPTNDPHPLPGQIAQARRLLATAQEILRQDNPRMPTKIRKIFLDRARSALQQVVEDYPTTPSSPPARQLLEKALPPIQKE